MNHRLAAVKNYKKARIPEEDDAPEDKNAKKLEAYFEAQRLSNFYGKKISYSEIQYGKYESESPTAAGAAAPAAKKESNWELLAEKIEREGGWEGDSKKKKKKKKEKKQKDKKKKRKKKRKKTKKRKRHDSSSGSSNSSSSSSDEESLDGEKSASKKFKSAAGAFREQLVLELRGLKGLDDVCSVLERHFACHSKTDKQKYAMQASVLSDWLKDAGLQSDCTTEGLYFMTDKNRSVLLRQLAEWLFKLR